MIASIINALDLAPFIPAGYIAFDNAVIRSLCFDALSVSNVHADVMAVVLALFVQEHRSSGEQLLPVFLAA